MAFILYRRHFSRFVLLFLVPATSIGLVVWVILASGKVLPETKERHAARFAPLPEHAAPLVQAIERYCADHQAPPLSLLALVPNYLDKVPFTGVRGYPRFEYKCYSGPLRTARVLWYNLGEIRTDAATGLEVTCPQDRLVFRFVGAGVLQRQRDCQEGTTATNTGLTVGRSTLHDVITKYGLPDGDVSTHDRSWSLYVSCPRRWDTSDKVRYCPHPDLDEAYFRYGCWRLGDWAYVPY